MSHRIIAAACGLALTAASDAQVIDARVTTGVPQVTMLRGQAVPWRFVSVRAGSGYATLEAKLPECVDLLHATPRALDRAAVAARPLACAGFDGAAPPQALEQQWAVRWRLPRPIDGGPVAELSWHRWYTPSFGGNRRAAMNEERAQAELFQAIGTAKATFGYTVPLGATRTADPWATTTAGLRWSLASRVAMELVYDLAREMQGTRLDRQVTMRVSRGGAGLLRWSAFATRQVDDARDRWDAGFGLDWRF